MGDTAVRPARDMCMCGGLPACQAAPLSWGLTAGGVERILKDVALKALRVRGVLSARWMAAADLSPARGSTVPFIRTRWPVCARASSSGGPCTATLAPESSRTVTSLHASKQAGGCEP